MGTQEAYELMRIYLARPGARQASVGGQCRYEITIDDVVHRCAIGCLFTPGSLAQVITVDEATAAATDYDEGDQVALRDFRGGLATIMQAGYDTPELDDVQGEFLDEAQWLHDKKDNWAENGFNIAALDDLARSFKLDVVIDEPQGAPQEEGALPVMA